MSPRSAGGAPRRHYARGASAAADAARAGDCLPYWPCALCFMKAMEAMKAKRVSIIAKGNVSKVLV